MIRVNEYIGFAHDEGRAVLQCRCGHVLGPAEGCYKDYSLEARYPIYEAGPYTDPYRLGADKFELREYYCPQCLVRYEAEVALRSDPVLRDVELDPSPREEVDGHDQA